MSDSKRQRTLSLPPVESSIMDCFLPSFLEMDDPAEFLLRGTSSLDDDALDVLIFRLLEEVTQEARNTKLVRAISRKGEQEKQSATASHHEPVSSTNEVQKDSSTSTIPAEALRQLIKSDFLTAAEKGRLLLLVSKSFVKGIGEHDVYSNLCQSRWPIMFSTILPREFEIAIQGRYEWLFKSLSRGLVTKATSRISGFPPLPPPELTPHNMILLVSFRHRGKEIMCESLGAEFLSKRFLSGRAETTFEEPVMSGEFEDEMYEDNTVRGLLKGLSATLHAFRVDGTNPQITCVHEYTQMEEIYVLDGDVTLSPDSPWLALNNGGKLLERRIQAYGRDPTSSYLLVSQIYFQLNLCYDLWPCPGNLSKRRPVLSGLSMDVQNSQHDEDEEYGRIASSRIAEYSQDTFVSRTAASTHGVTLCHFLDTLVGWDEDP